jgi:hypothetical protein
MAGFVADLAERYPLVSVEDGLAEDDWATRHAGREAESNGSASMPAIATSQTRCRAAADERHGRALVDVDVPADSPQVRGGEEAGHRAADDDCAAVALRVVGLLQVVACDEP